MATTTSNRLYISTATARKILAGTGLKHALGSSTPFEYMVACRRAHNLAQQHAKLLEHPRARDNFFVALMVASSKIGRWYTETISEAVGETVAQPAAIASTTTTGVTLVSHSAASIPRKRHKKKTTTKQQLSVTPALDELNIEKIDEEVHEVEDPTHGATRVIHFDPTLTAALFAVALEHCNLFTDKQANAIRQWHASAQEALVRFQALGITEQQQEQDHEQLQPEAVAGESETAACAITDLLAHLTPAQLQGMAQRRNCRKCNRKRALYCSECIELTCDASLVPRIALPVQLHIVLHPKCKRSNATSLQAKLLSHDGHVFVHLYPRIPAFDAASSLVLFPGPKAITMRQWFQQQRVADGMASAPPTSGVHKIIVLESAWGAAAEQLLEHRNIRSLPLVCLDPEARYHTQYWRDQHLGLAHLSTIEAAHYACREYVAAAANELGAALEYDEQQLSALLFLFACERRRLETFFRERPGLLPPVQWS